MRRSAEQLVRGVVAASAEFKADYQTLFPKQWLFDCEEGQYPAIYPSGAIKGRKASAKGTAKL